MDILLVEADANLSLFVQLKRITPFRHIADFLGVWMELSCYKQSFDPYLLPGTDIAHTHIFELGSSLLHFHTYLSSFCGQCHLGEVLF